MSQAKLSLLSRHASPITSSHSGGYAVVSKLFVFMTQLPRLVQGLPIYHREQLHAAKEAPLSAQQLYLNLLVSALLVLLGGCFAGLTIGLMGQDEVYLKVLASSGDKRERKHSKKVLSLISRGKHWVLITLLLSNVITNETLPIILDRCLGGGWPAVVTSTASIVVFGEIIPQSICVRYGLEVGSYCSPFVLVLMYIMYPIAYPIALFLDHLLGQDHGTVYKKSGLKTLVTLHKTMGVERLNQDEVTIISAVLDLKEKSVSSIMTPIDRVYTMSADTLLDEKTVEEIFNAGFSRIPIHLPGEPMNFIGMLLVRVLISYDPEDALPVASFPLATLPETGEETSCLNILNYFQEGKSHMIVVSSNPGEPYGALGVLTLEDVIEELIGEEIVDESDVYIDINKNIKRTQPGPLSKRNLTSYLHNLYHKSSNASHRNSMDQSGMLTPLKDKGHHLPNTGSSPGSRHGVLLANASPILGTTDASKTWKPINLADNPLETSKLFVHIKRPNDAVKNSVLPGPKGTLPNSNGYGTIHMSEESAAKEAKEMINHVKKNGSKPSQFLLPDEREADLTDVTDGHDSKRQLEPPSSPNVDTIGELQELRSYRTGGIIESIVNVQGVHKTIIENVSDEEMDNHTSSGSHSHIHDAFVDGDEAEMHLLPSSASRSSSSLDKKKKRSKHKR